MSAWKRLLGKRPYALCLAGGLLALLAGDRAQLAPPPGVGIDPFEVLDQQVRNNVLIILDTSGSMKWPSDRDDFTLGADDPGSRMFQAKAAIKAVVASNQNRVNFGLMSYNILSAGKTLNKGQDFEGDGRVDGPFIYVSADANAAQFYTAFSSVNDAATTESEVCNAVDGFFCAISNTFANYDGANSGDVWRSFMNRNGTNQALAYNDPYPAGCTVGAGQLSPVDLSAPAAMRCRYYMQSRLIRNGQRFTWNRASTNVTTRLTATAAITCPAPPAGLVGYTSTNSICFQMADSVTGNTATFYYSSSVYENQSGNACGGGALITQVAACTANNAPIVLANMDPELPVDPTGQLVSVPAPPGNATFDFGDGHLDGDQTTPAGLRADQSTPLAGSLDSIRLATGAAIAFPPLPIDAPNQKNFVILVTDGDDTCANSNTDRAAVLAGVAASQLYNGPDFQHKAETLVVGFASAVNPARVNVIAQGGSGAIINGAATNPATAVTGCSAGGACRNAFFASNTQQLIDILNAALEQASATGVFSTTPSVFSGVPEYIDTLATPPPSPSPVPSPFSVMNPDRRYNGAAFRSYRASFDVAGFRGFVHGTDNFGVMTGPAIRPTPSPSPSPVPTGPMPVYPRNWEAGARMLEADRVSSDLATVDHTFAGIMTGASAPQPPLGTNALAPVTAAVQNNHIRRRIFTTRQNGRRLARIGATPAADDMSGSSICAGPCRVNLWPPSDTVAPGPPSYDYTGTTWRTPGILDTRLFRKDDGTQMTLADLQGTPLFACKGTNLPAGCLTTAPAADQLLASQKEAREMILAFTAGAAPQRDNQGFPARTAAGLINYRRRAWLLSESTVGSPALVTPPRQQPPTLHTQEYLLYRDGPRDNAGTAVGTSDLFIRQGFGLRNPDRDGKETPAGALNRTNVKPVMSIVYVPANDMLHAFRAGPCPASAGASCGTGIFPGSPTGNQETGGEELWAFVPHDLLPHLKDKMKVQTRTAHTFMISTSLRTADVFVPGLATLTFGSKTYTVTGRWRRFMYFGRGLGGKYYTALDITGVGSLTAATLDTELPGVLWNRGNPDTQDGLSTGTLNNTAGDATLYLDMGQTWSTPSLARVTPNTVNGNREFLLFTGSGYSSGPANEGTRFYALDPVSGDVVYSGDVGQGLQPAFRNALVASPIAYAAGQFVSGLNLPHPGTSPADSVFIGDIHGRLWKFNLTDPTTPGTPILFRNLGPDQPIAVEAGLLNLSGKANVYVETGFDARLTTAPSVGWALYGFRDDGPAYPAAAVLVPSAGPPTFAQAFGNPPPAGKGDWRGTVSPVTGFITTGGATNPAVVFIGTRFNPIAAGRCISTFDTILVSLNGTNGANYWSRSWDDVRAQGLPTIPIADPGPTSEPPVDKSKGTAGGGTGSGNMPPDKTTIPATAKTTVIRPGSSVCR